MGGDLDGVRQEMRSEEGSESEEENGKEKIASGIRRARPAALFHAVVVCQHDIDFYKRL